MFRRIAAAVLGIALLSGCVPLQPLEDPPERPDSMDVSLDGKDIQEGGHLVMGLSNEPDELDPSTSSSLYSRYVFQTMCQKLYDIDSSGEIVPMLATQLPKVANGGKTVTIPVRQDAKFADGTKFDAEAVRKTLQRNMDLEDSGRRSEMGPITDIKAINDYTVQVDFKTPFSPLAAALSDRAGMIMSPKALDEEGENFSDNPVCVGPFKFKERIPQTSITVVRDPNYYDPDSVHLDEITYRIMNDANIRAANVRSEDVQVADSISPQDFDALVQEKNIGTLSSNSLGYQGLTINMSFGEDKEAHEKPLAKDKRVRLALAKAFDKGALVNTVFNGWYTPACSGISPDSPFATEASRTCIKPDPAESKRLLKEAGVKTPYSIDVTVTNDQDSLRYAQALQASVKDAGFELKIHPLEYTALLDAQDRGDFEMIILGWSGRVDPHHNLYNYYHTGASNNYTGLDDPVMNKLLDKAAEATDQKTRNELYGKVTARMNADPSTIYTYRKRNLTAYTKNIAGIQVYADGVVHLSGAAFLKGAQ